MKTALLALSFFLLFSFTTHVFPIEAAQFLYDIGENPMVKNGIYKILPTDASGISLSATDNTAGCELAVVDANTASSYTVKIGTPDSVTYLTTETRIVFSFNNPPSCAKGPNWIAVQYPASQFLYLMIGTQDQHTGGIDQSGFFNIKALTTANTYKLVYCVSSVCNDVGINVDGQGNRHLAITPGNPTPVKFEKASAISASVI